MGKVIRPSDSGVSTLSSSRRWKSILARIPFAIAGTEGDRVSEDERERGRGRTVGHDLGGESDGEDDESEHLSHLGERVSTVYDEDSTDVEHESWVLSFISRRLESEKGDSPSAM